MDDDGGNPDSLMNLKPDELKKLKNGEFRVYVGLKFSVLERSYSRLENRFWVVIAMMFTLLVTIIMSMVA